MGRIVLGFFLTPPAAGLATLFYGWMLGIVAQATGYAIPGAVPLPVAVGLGIYAFVLGIPVTGLVALPVFAYVRRRRPVTVVIALVTGVCCATGTYLVMVLWIFLFQSKQTSWQSQLESALDFYAGFRLLGFLLLMAAIGATAAASFWIVAVSGTSREAKS